MSKLNKADIDKYMGVIIVGTIVFIFIVGRFIDGVVMTVLMTFVLLAAIYFGLKFFFGIDVFVHLTTTSNSDSTTLDVVFDKTTGSPPPPPKKKPQVFNISQNIFGYDDAKTVCRAYGARLATYSEMEDAYNSGAGWCNYGWSDGQMALFPTQKAVFDSLQTQSGHEHDCGRPGINGGYMANAELKFGANCFGSKPAITSDEQMLMETQPAVPPTKSESDAANKIEYWQKNLNKLLVSPFNHSNWSRY